MFGSSTPSREINPTGPSSQSSTQAASETNLIPSQSLSKITGQTGGAAIIGDNQKHESVDSPLPATETAMKDDAPPAGEKKRKSGKASALLASARNSFHFSGSSHSSSGDKESNQTPLQRLGRKDPALAVPQGANNNSAGNSMPTARSTFRVGVTEDKNKKCRRTMEDTHSYLYNFLSTPAPDLSDVRSTGGKSAEESSTDRASSSVAPTESSPSPVSQNMIETDNGYFAIFDGHAGTFAADWCGKKLHLILEDAIRKHPNTPIPELLDHTFTNVDQQLEKLPVKNSGCTAVIAVLRWEDRIPSHRSATGSSAIAPAAAAAALKTTSEATLGAPGTDRTSRTSPDRRSASSQAVQSFPPADSMSAQARLQDAAIRRRVLYTANVGDARIVLCRNGKALRLSYDHKGSDENEGKRVINAGGLILNNRVNGVLAVTRALGDAYMKDLVTGHPYTTETVIQTESDEFIILACDGLWDVCSDQEAVDLVRDVVDPQFASKLLVDHALARFSTDNLSCMIVRFDNNALQDTVERRNGAELIGVEGDPATVRGGVSEADAIVAEARQKVEDEDRGPLKPDGKRVPDLLPQVAKESSGPGLISVSGKGTDSRKPTA